MKAGEQVETPEYLSAMRGMMEDAIDMGVFGVPGCVAPWHLGDDMARRGLMTRTASKAGVDYAPTQAGREWLAAQGGAS